MEFQPRIIGDPQGSKRRSKRERGSKGENETET